MIFGIWKKATIESWKHTFYLWGKWRSDKNIRVNVRDDLNTSESLALENLKLEDRTQNERPQQEERKRERDYSEEIGRDTFERDRREHNEGRLDILFSAGRP